MNKVNDKLAAFDQWLWCHTSDETPFFIRFLKSVIRTFSAVLRDLRGGQLSLRAMSLVYTTVIAIVPLLALSFSVLKGFGMHNSLEPALLEAMVDLGDKRHDIASNVMGFIDNVNVGVLGAVGFGVLIYSVISMMHKIEMAFNYTWQIKRSRGMSDRFRDYLSVVFIAPLLIFLSAAITASVQTDQALGFIHAIPFGAGAVAFFSKLIPYLIMSIGFAFIYAFLPNTRVNLRAAFIGGLVTAIIWKLMGWSVSIFVANSASNIAIYSAFASVIILMVWMYLGWLVLLVGASVAFYQQNPQFMRVNKNEIQLSPEAYEKLVLNVVYLVADSFSNGKQPWHVDALAKRLNVASTIIDELLDLLEQHKYIVRKNSTEGHLFLQRPLEKILLSELIFCVRGNTLSKRQQEVCFDSAVSDVFDITDQVLKKTLAEKTVKDLVS